MHLRFVRCIINPLPAFHYICHLNRSSLIRVHSVRLLGRNDLESIEILSICWRCKYKSRQYFSGQTKLAEGVMQTAFYKPELGCSFRSKLI